MIISYKNLTSITGGATTQKLSMLQRTSVALHNVMIWLDVLTINAQGCTTITRLKPLLWSRCP